MATVITAKHVEGFLKWKPKAGSNQPAMTRTLHVGEGVYLVVDKRGKSARWIYRYTTHGKAHTMGLGAYDDTVIKEGKHKGEQIRGLKKARELAADARKLRGNSTDPILAREEKHRVARLEANARTAAMVTFQRAAEGFTILKDGTIMDGHHNDIDGAKVTVGGILWKRSDSKWRAGAGSEEQWRSALRDHVYPIIGALPVADITVEQVEQVLKQTVLNAAGEKVSFWDEMPVTAGRCQTRMKQVFEYATLIGLRTMANPANWSMLALKGLETIEREAEHHNALHWRDVPAFLARLQADGRVQSLALQLTILTGVRAGSLMTARWSEFDLATPGNETWTIPKERVKALRNKMREHPVPLSPAALAILQELGPRDGDSYVFSLRHGKPMSKDCMWRVLREMIGDAATVHGFRASFSTWAHDAAHYPPHIIEAALAHIIPEVDPDYARTRNFLEKRRPLMNDWSAYVTGQAVSQQAEAA